MPSIQIVLLIDQTLLQKQRCIRRAFEVFFVPEELDNWEAFSIFRGARLLPELPLSKRHDGFLQSSFTKDKMTVSVLSLRYVICPGTPSST